VFFYSIPASGFLFNDISRFLLIVPRETILG